MADIMLHRDHALGLRKAKAAANRIARELADEFDCDCDWDGNTLTITRAGVDGRMKVAKDRVDVHVKLGFLLSAFKPKIEQSINDNFDRYFG
ncbi:MAG: polyhydroxyalkanoic acid system family protein [Lautropia sp.]